MMGEQETDCMERQEWIRSKQPNFNDPIESNEANFGGAECRQVHLRKEFRAGYVSVAPGKQTQFSVSRDEDDGRVVSNKANVRTANPSNKANSWRPDCLGRPECHFRQIPCVQQPA